MIQRLRAGWWEPIACVLWFAPWILDEPRPVIEACGIVCIALAHVARSQPLRGWTR
jgi:hypothetical protein